MIHSHKQQGFTLVELMLSIAFIGFIMIFVVTTIVQVMRTYNKGLAVKEISQIARTSLDDISRNARNASNVEVNALAANRLCLGNVSYVWNTRDNYINKYASGTSDLTFARVNDPAGEMCKPKPLGYDKVPVAEATQLLTNRVWVNALLATKDINGHVLDLNLQLSTADDSHNALDLLSNPVTCKGGSTGEFCAVANFTTTVVLKGE